MKLEPIEFRTGEAKKMLDIFNELEVSKNKKRHVAWITKEAILIQKQVSTRNVNEFIINDPSGVDVKLVEEFFKQNNLSCFTVPEIKIDKTKETYNS